MALLILKYCSPGIAVLFHLPSTDLDFLFFSLFPVLPLWHGLVRTRRREMRNPLLVERVLADLKNGPLLSMPSKTLVYKQRPLPHGKLHRFAQSGVQFFMQSARQVRGSRTEYPLLSMPTKTPFARFFFALAKTFIALHNRELRFLCWMPYR